MAEENVATEAEVAQDGSQPEAVSEQQQTPEKQKGSTTQSDVVPRRDLQRLQASLDRQNQALRKRIQELELASVEPDQRETVELKQTVAEQRTQLETYQRMAVLKDMELRYGVPGSILDEATSTQHAQQIALDYLANSQQGTGGTAPATSQETQHTPFVAPVQAGKSTKRDFEKEFKAALDSGDRSTYIRLVREYEESLAASS